MFNSVVHMRTPRETFLRGVFLLLVLVMTWVAMTRLPLFDEDEGEYAEVAVEMAHSHDFVTPTLNGTPFYEKPILAFWLEAPLVDLFGTAPWVFRLPSEIACLLWLWLIIGFSREFFSREVASLAPLFCATSMGVVVSAQAAAMDGVLSALIAASFFDSYRFFIKQKKHYVLRTFLWMSLGFLAKGPIAVVVPFIGTLWFFASERKLRLWSQAIFYWPGWGLFLLIVLPWYVMQYHLMGQSFIDYFLLRENIGRLMGSLQGHSGHWWYYFPVLLFIALPHTWLLLRSMVWGWQDRHRVLIRFLLIWFASVFIIFSVAQTKLPHYLLIGLTPLFILMAFFSRRLTSSIGWWAVILIECLIMVMLPHYVQQEAGQLHGQLYLQALLSRFDGALLDSYYFFLVGLIVVSLILTWLLRFFLKISSIESGRLVTIFSHHVALLFLLLPVVAQLQERPVQDLALMAKQLGGPVVADNRMPSFAVLLGHPTENRHAKKGELVFLRVDQLNDYPYHEVILQEGGLVLLRVN